MKINPTYSASEIAAKIRVSAKPASSLHTSPVWGQDGYVPAPYESSYLTYDRLGETDHVYAQVREAVDAMGETNASSTIGSNKSIYDFSWKQLKSVMDQVEQACNELDTTGMSKSDIYKNIESIFIQYFGKDFREPNITCFSSNVSKENFDAMIRGEILWPPDVHSRFGAELQKHGIAFMEDSKVVSAAKYPGLTGDELRTAVRSNYPEQMTLKDCMVMQWELWEVGLAEPCAGIIPDEFAHIMGTNKATLPQLELAEKLFNVLLAMPADYETFMMTSDRCNQEERKQVYDLQDITELKEKLFSMFAEKERYSAWLEESNECETVLQELFDAGYTKPFGNNLRQITDL